MKCDDVKLLLNDYVDGTLPSREHAVVNNHLAGCAECRQHREFLRGLLARTARLPRDIPPPRDLWSGIAAKLEPHRKAGGTNDASTGRRDGGALPDRGTITSSGKHRRPAWKVATFAAAASVVILVSAIWVVNRASGPTWSVAHLEGRIRIGGNAFDRDGLLAVGEWLETENASRARINVGLIGELDVEPASRLRLLDAEPTNHRVELARGTIHARIWAPPRLFFVETPSATAIDLGCAYTLAVDSTGSALLMVSGGYVALQHDGKESIVPAGAACRTRPDIGPGTPFRLSARPDFRSALEQFDAGNNPDALNTILASARPEDALSLWHLLQRTDGHEQELVFERFALLSSLPSGVTREGILQKNKEMLSKCGEAIGLNL